MKKWAIRGLVTLSVVVALCMFFSGTIKNLTTARSELPYLKSDGWKKKLLSREP